MNFLKRYDYLVLYLAAITSFFAAYASKNRLIYVALGMTQIAMGIMLMNKSKNA